VILWDDQKNRKLQEERGVSFEEIAERIMRREILAILKNPSRENQLVFVIPLRGYTYGVPFVEDEHGNVVLKTAYPSRKLHGRYGGKSSGKKP